MKEYGAFIDNELKPAIFRAANVVFPEMDFTPFRGGWESDRKLFGIEPTSQHRKDKSVITTKHPNRILEQGGESIEVIEYYRQQNNLKDRNEAIKELCNILRLTPPEMPETPQYRAHRELQETLMGLVGRMQRELFEEPDAASALKYLKETRGYTDEEIRGMGFGWCSLDVASALNSISGKSGYAPQYRNYVAIPYISSGRITGVVFRNITDNGSKYINFFINEKETKKYNLFGLTGLPTIRKGNNDKHEQEIIVVEGEIDALRAQYLGLSNVVGAASKNLSQEALSGAKAMGIERVILLFDYDKGQDKTTDIKAALENIREAELTGFVAEFPKEGEKVDTDSYLSDHTAEQFRLMVYGVNDNGETFDNNGEAQGAIFGCIWELLNIVNPYAKNNITDIERDKLRREVAEYIYSGRLLRWERDMLINYIPQLTTNLLTAEAVKGELSKIEDAQRQRRQEEQAKALIEEAQKRVSSGETLSALDLLQDRAHKIISLSQETEYSKLFELPTHESILSGLRSKKGGIPTGFLFYNTKGKPTEWEIPTGALTYICAPTSHGKSRFIQNLALRLAQNDRMGSVLYISLEEDTDAVTERLINIQVGKPLNDGSNYNSQTIREYYGEGNERYLKKELKNDLEAAYKEIESLLSTGRLIMLSRKEYGDLGFIEKLSGLITYALKQRPVQAVFIDYVQEIYSKGYKGSRKEELMDICNSLMDVSVRTGLPIVLAAQLNREASSPLDMSVQNIADASNIEHSANCVLLLWDSIVPPVAGKDNSYSYYSTKNGEKERKLTKEAEALESRGFKIGQGGSLYAILAKNRLGERNIDAVLEYDGNTGKVKTNSKTGALSKEERERLLNFQQDFFNESSPNSDNYEKPF